MSQPSNPEPTSTPELPSTPTLESLASVEPGTRRSAESLSRLEDLNHSILGLHQGVVLVHKRSRHRMHFNRLGLLGIQDSPSESPVNLLERRTFLKELQQENPDLYALLQQQDDKLPDTIILLDELPEKQLRHTPEEQLMWRYWSWTMMGMLRRAWRHSSHSDNIDPLLRIIGFAAFEEARMFFVRRRYLFEVEERALLESVDRDRAEAHYWDDLKKHWEETAEMLVGWWGMLTVFAPEQRKDYFPGIDPEPLTKWLEKECGLDFALLAESSRFEGLEDLSPTLPQPPEQHLPEWKPAAWLPRLSQTERESAHQKARSQIEDQLKKQEKEEHPGERPLFLQFLHMALFAVWRWLNVNVIGLVLSRISFEGHGWLAQKGAEWALQRHLFSLSYHLNWAAYAHMKDNESEALLQFVEVTLYYKDLIPEEQRDNDEVLQQLEAYRQRRVRQIARLYCDAHELKGEETRESLRELLTAVSQLSLSTRLGKQGSTVIKSIHRSYLDRQRDFYRSRLWTWVLSNTVEGIRWVLSGAGRPFHGLTLNEKLPYYKLVRSLHYVQVAQRAIQTLPCSETERHRWGSPIHTVHELLEAKIRSTFEPYLLEAIEESGLTPAGHRELIARNKIKDEMLDLVIQRGTFNFSDVRDVISRNELRLPDITWREILRGDQLLRLNKALKQHFSEIYRPGEFYLRNLQRLSSLAFGTNAGRWLCRYILIPFGGSAVILGGIGSLLSPFYNSPARISLLRGTNRVQITANVVLARLPKNKPEPAKGKKAGKKADKKAKKKQVMGAGKVTATSKKPAGKTAKSKVNSDIEQVQNGLKRLGVKVRDVQISLYRGKRSFQRKAVRIVSVTPGSPAERGGLQKGDILLSMNRELITNRHDLGVRAYAHHFSLMYLSTILLLGFLLFLIIHTQQGRSIFRQTLAGIGNSTRFLFSALPRAIFRDPAVRAVLTSEAVLWFYRLLLVPLTLTLLLSGPFLLLFEWLELPRHFSWTLFGSFMAIFLLLLNTATGRNAWDSLVSRVLTFWQQVRDRWLLGLMRWTLDFFQRMMIALDYILYRVDDLLRFHRHEKREVVLLKAFFQSIWAGVAYVLRFIIYLMVEPQLNPFKHFPVVTVSHKLLIPYSAAVLVMMRNADYSSALIWLVTAFFQFGLPGIFGFLVWEFKENWREFKANEPEEPPPIRVGSHGETMDGLLRRGFHSGTLPRLYEKLMTSNDRRFAALKSETHHHERLQEDFHHMEEAIACFVERDLLTGLQLQPELKEQCPLSEVRGIDLYRTHINLRFALLNADKTHESPWEIRIELEGTWLLGSVRELPPSDERESLEWTEETLALFNRDLVTFLQKAGVRIVRSTLEERIRFYLTDCEIGTPGAVQADARAEYFVNKEKIRVQVHTEQGKVEKQYFDLDEFGKMREPSNLIALHQGTRVIPSS